jgi:hypothetical protein
MAIQITERFDVGFHFDLERPQRDYTYMVTGTENEGEVESIVESTVPGFRGSLIVKDYSAKHEGAGVWEVVVHYEHPSLGARKILETDDPAEFSFEIGGQNEKIYLSKQTIASYPSSPTPRDFGKALNVNETGVDGADVLKRTLAFSYRKAFPPGSLTAAFIFGVYSYAMTVNSATWKGFAAGEVLFLGCQGGERGTQNPVLTFRFLASPNRTGEELATGIVGNAKGWEYIWAYFERIADPAKAMVRRPKQVNVEKIYETSDFNGLPI